MEPADIENLSRVEKKKLAEQSISILNDVNQTTEQRKEAIVNLTIINELVAIEPLIQALKDNDSELRRSAAEALLSFPDIHLHEHLLPITFMDEQEKRKLTEQSISILKDVNQTTEQRKEAISDLIIIGDSIAIEPLIQALKDNDSELRRSAAEALLWFPDVRSIEPLLAIALDDTNIFVRQDAARTLKYIKDEKAVRALIEVFKIENPNLRTTAANSLVKLGELSVLPLLEMLDTAITSMLYWIINLLARIGDKRAVKHLIGLIKNQDSEMRKYIISYLSNFEDDTILPFLFQLQNTEPDEAVRVTIAEVIEELQEQDSE